MSHRLREFLAAAKGPFIAGLGYGIALVLSLPPVGIWWLAFVSLIPLYACARRSTASARTLFVAVAAGVAPAIVYEEWFIIDTSAAGFAPLIVYLSLYPALFVLLCRRVLRVFPGFPGPLAGALIIVTIEVVRGRLIFNGYDWFNVAQPLIDSAWAAAPGAVVGLSGVSFLVALASLAVYEVVAERRRPRAADIASIAVPVIAFAVSPALLARADGPPARVGLVQTNLAQSNKLRGSGDDHMTTWRELVTNSQHAAKASPRPDVILWPETMKPGFALDSESVAAERGALTAYDITGPDGGMQKLPTVEFADAMPKLSEALGIPLLVGEDSFTGLTFTLVEGSFKITYAKRWNSVFLVSGGMVSPVRYDKIHRTPFGEEVPHVSAWPALRDWLLAFGATGLRLDLSAGVDRTVFAIERAGTSGDGAASATLPPLRLVTPICFEVTDPDLCRRLVIDGGGVAPAVRRADVYASPSNDGWFYRSEYNRRQHVQLAQWRALENATPMLRAANTGISCIIDHRGRIVTDRVMRFRGGDYEVAESDWDVDGFLVSDVATCSSVTIFSRFGWLFPWACGAMALVMIAASWVCKASRSGGKPAPADTLRSSGA